MATMIPAECADTTESRAELDLFRRFVKEFDDNWTIFHSFNILGRNRQQKLIDGEIDFLLLHPAKGILLLEVKGGQISHRNGRWYQYEKELKLPPSEQVRLNKYNIINLLKKRLSKYIHLNIGHAVCFPDCYSVVDLPADIDAIAITGRMVDHLELSVVSIMDDWNKGNYKPLDQTAIDAILNALMPIFDIGICLADKIGLEERRFIQLTEQQCELLNFIDNYRQVLIRGCAGSGKTIMAVKKAKALSQDGLSVLLLCYNKLLGERLKVAIDGYDNITVSTYHDFCFKHLGKAGYNVDPKGRGESFWNDDIPEMFANYLTDNPIKYDALIVDEGQDFREDYWITLAELIKDDGWYYIFYDPDQNLFATQLKLPNLSEPFVLNCNCRNTRQIFNAIKPYAQLEFAVSDKVPEGEAVTRIASSSAAESVRVIGKLLHKLVVDSQISEDKIIIIGGHSLKNTRLREAQAGAFRIKANGPSGKNLIPYYTYYKYKGCESDVVIILDLDKNDPRWQTDKAIYASMSRAKHLLFIIESEQ